ncbi:ABC transporter ATP-binding protein [Duganella sp. BJB488]|uniref:cyanophycin metabolism-associated ABC transporter n=1 Tax=unclassified Duganella TaxID=2636909 RepID=UPI000E34E216|nr:MULTISPECIES: ABC transporter ATP-binding protein [unclassified Duganella]RFP09074.1 ABC transporter ATP-binding protein [Duganella sp. BJB489]RFP11844.1 ABC transporter ATP-binding protein [Duganella sp. BJB488]RFP29070.1 ABC transporter ATP-binding protein [Duganella sp. BJB480]
MTTEQLSSNTSQSELPERWRSEVQAQLSQGENAVSALEVDLDEQLRFSKGVIVVTERGVLARAPGRADWQHWPFAKDLALKHHDHAGVGHLELVNNGGRLGAWRFTLGQNLQAIRLVEQFNAHRDSHALGVPVVREEKNVCPSCKAPLEPEQEECPICTKVVYTPPSTWTLFRLWRFAGPYKLQLGFGFALMLLSTGAHMIPPYLTIPLMDKVLIPYQNGAPVDTSLVALYMSGLVGSAVLAWILGWGKTYVLALVSERIGADLRTETYDHLLRLSLEYFGGKRTGDLMSRIGSESDRICVFLSLHLLDFASDCLMIIMTGVILFSIDPWLAIFTLLPLPFIAWLIHVVRDRLRTGFEKIDRVWGEVTNVLADTIPGIRVVKAFAQESREAARFRTANKHNLAVNDKLNKIWSLFSPTVSFLTELGLLVIWVFGIYQVSKGHITVGVLSAFIAYSSRFYGRLDSMSRIVSVTQKSASAAKRIFDILDHVSSVPEPANPVKLAKVDGNITLREVGFRYGNRAVNRGISLDIKAGEMIGLVGHSGSGKSTLVNLICRFYDVSEGAIMLDGVDIRSFAVSDYRRNIGLVLQEPFLFFGTIAENLAYGKPGATRAEIIAAARAAHAHEFILRLPQGYDSMVGERGQGLSGGERQRISIARALLIDPKILILDEATSSVDSETEKEIQRALENLVQGRTTIAIAHRLSTLQKADRLVVLDRGVVVEEGAHDDLMAREGAYYRLYQAQARNVDTDLDDSGSKD